MPGLPSAEDREGYNPSPTPSSSQQNNETDTGTTTSTQNQSSGDETFTQDVGGGPGGSTVSQAVRDRQAVLMGRGMSAEDALAQAKIDVRTGANETDPYDEYSEQILAELQGLASGEIKSTAEKQAAQMGRQFGTAAYAVSKSRRGVAPGAMFSEGGRQASIASRMGRQQAEAIGKQTRETAAQQALQFQAAKEAERRGLGAQYKAMQQQAAIAAEQASAGLFGSFMGFLGSIGAGLIASYSDERLKTNIDRGRGKADLMEFLNSLDVATYDKHVFGHHRHETGIMAQSAERSKVGRQFVKEVKGYKSIDANAATGPILASLKLLHDRLDDLEKPKKKKRGKK